MVSGVNLHPYSVEAVVLDSLGCDALTAIIERKDIFASLKNVQLFDSLTAADKHELVAEIVARPFQQGEVLIKQGDLVGNPEDTFYIIHQGEIVVMKDLKDGRDAQPALVIGRQGLTTIP